MNFNQLPLSAAQRIAYATYFHRMQVGPKTVLLREGDIAGKLFFVEKGSLRAWFNKDGKDITLQFFFENDVVASIESFRKNIPSPVTIESIEPATLWWIAKDDINKLLNEGLENKALREIIIDRIFERTYDYMKQFLSAIKDSPEQRYLQLMADMPQLILRVPQHYIAAYLGISTVHLSRIKSKLAKARHAPI